MRILLDPRGRFGYFAAVGEFKLRLCIETEEERSNLELFFCHLATVTPTGTVLTWETNNLIRANLRFRSSSRSK